MSGDAWVSGNAHCEFGWYFAYKKTEWKITEIKEGEDGILLVKDYQPPKESERQEGLSGKEVDVIVDGKKYTVVIK